MPAPQFEDWGLVDYLEAEKRQLACVEQVLSISDHPGYLIFCSHPPVVTCGRQTQNEDLFAWQGPVVNVARGGRATYHGPSQLVVYPIISIKQARSGRGPQEIRGFLRALEAAIVATLKDFGVIEAIGRTPQKKTEKSQAQDETGVWIGARKIASLGIAVKKWVTYHGAAINLRNDPSAFVGLKPCGFDSSTMISLEEALGLAEFNDDLIAKFKERLRLNCGNL